MIPLGGFLSQILFICKFIHFTRKFCRDNFSTTTDVSQPPRAPSTDKGKTWAQSYMTFVYRRFAMQGLSTYSPLIVKIMFTSARW